MTTATLAPAVAPPVAVAPVSFEARLAARDAVMTVLLEAAGLQHAVNAAAPETAVDVAAPAPAPATVDLYPTPVAALLHRAHNRIITGGWSRTAGHTSGGAMCLAEAIRAEAHTHRDEGEARILLRHALGGGDPIPEMNRRLGSASQAAAVLATAANMAADRGI